MSESNVGKFLNFLGAAEGASYNTIVGGGNFTSYDKHPGQVGLVTKDGPSTAAGKYQITKTTYDDVAPKLGITDFSPASQDRIALYLIQRNGSLDDVRAGNFEAAIAKNGGTWASLPSSPYNQPKRSMEWVNSFFGGNIKPTAFTPPALQNQPTAPIEPVNVPGRGAIDMAFQEAQGEAKNTWLNQAKNLPSAIGLGFETQNGVYNWLVDRNIQQIDREHRITKELAEDLTRGIPPDHHGYILAHVSKEDAYRRRAKVEESLKKQQELASMGGAGVVGTLTGSLLDLPTLVGFIPGLGTASVISKTNRIKNALATGMAMSVGNVAGEAVLQKYKPLGTDDDLYWAAGAGLGFGAIIGGAAKTTGRAAGALSKEMDELAGIGQRSASSIQKAEIKSAGLELTEKGRRQLDPEYRQEQVAKQEAAAIRAEGKASVSEAPRPGSAREALESMAKSTDEKVAAIARRFSEQLPDDVKVVQVAKKDLKGSPGGYDPVTNTIYLTKGASETTKLHEVAHALTMNKVAYGLANPNSAHGAIVQELQAVYKQALDAAQKAGFDSYYLKDLQEFAAGIYGGKNAKPFVEFLSKIDADGQPLLSKLVDTLRRVLGFEASETNLFLKSLDVTDRLIDEKSVMKAESRVGKETVFDDPELKDYMPEKGTGNVGFSALGPALENYFARSWVPQKARDVFHKLAGATAGYKNHGVVEQHASEVAGILGKAWTKRTEKAWQPSFTKYFTDLMEEGKATKWQETELFGDWERSLGNYIRGFDGDYHPTVIKAGNEIRPILRDALDHINNPGKFNGAVKRGLTQVEEIDPVTGNKTLTDALPYNDNYLPRHPDIGKINTFIGQFGRETADRFWANAFAKANPDASAEAAARFGKYYITRLQDSKLNRQNLDMLMKGADRESFRKELVEIGQMTEQQAEEILMSLLPGKKDKANPLSKNLKNRSGIDESYSETIITKDGETHIMTINDFIDTRTIDVLSAYYARTAGAVSLANNMDVYRATDVDRIIADATKQEFGSAIPETQRKGVEDHLRFTFDRVMSRPVEEFTVENKLMQMWRDLNVSRLMGFATFNQVQEMSQIVGAMGWKTTTRAIPELKAMVRDAKTGKVANDMIDQLENLTGGAGADLLHRTDLSPRDDWVRQRGDTPFNQWLDRADTLLNKGSTNLLKYTGMTGLMVQQKRIHAIAMINHFVEAADGKMKLAFSKERLAWMGLDEADTQKVLDGIKSFHSPKEGSKVGTVDFEKWQASDPESYAKFIVAYRRESHRVVQENDLASMVPIMGKGWGQTLFQFMNFSLQGWNKSMLFAMNHKDFQTYSTVMHGSLFAAATYITRTNAQMIGMSAEERADFAEKRLSNKQIVANSFGRIAQVSLMPILIDSTIAPTPWFSGARTTSNVTDFIGSNPTLSAISGLLSMPRKIALASASDEVQVSEKDVRSWMRLLPFNNVIGITNVLNSIAADYPNSDKQE